MPFMEIETNPGTAVLIILFATFLLIGLATLTGTLALLIWLLIGAVLFVIGYMLLTRGMQWARGERGGEA